MVEEAATTKRKSICIGVYVSPDMHNKLKKYSKESETMHGVKYTISDVVRLALKDFFDKNK